MYSLLIVDDEEIILNGIRDTIMSSDLPFKSVKTAGTGRKALQLFEESPFDIILSDIRMPDMDGLEMAQAVRSMWPETRIVFLTGYREFDYARKALQLKSEDYLIKPVSDEKLVESIREVICRLDLVWTQRFERQYLLKQEENSCILPDREGYVLLLYYRRSTGRMKEEELQEHMQGLLKNCFLKRCKTVEVSRGNGYVAACVQPVQLSEWWEHTALKMIEEIQTLFLEKIDVNMTAGLSERLGLSARMEIIGGMYDYCCRMEAFGGLFRFPGRGSDAQSVTAERSPRSTTDFEPVMPDLGYNYVIAAIAAYIEANPEKDLSLGALSQRFCMNPSYLSRIFHQKMGIAVSEFITQKRLSVARRLLATTDLKIYEVAAQSGFETSGYFAKIFNKAENMAPKSWRTRTDREK